MPLQYAQLFENLVIDLVAIGVLAYGIYYRRHRRSDLVLAYVALNVSLFVAGAVILQQAHLGVAFGFGLFAILSLIRLRSDPITPVEVAYYFVALVLGLANGLQFRDRMLTILLDASVVGVMFLLDNRWVLPRSQHHVVTLDVVHASPAALVADLERRLGGRVTHCIVKELDYVRDITRVDVRFVGPPTDQGTRGSGSHPVVVLEAP
jgi:hypothetical protein